MSRPTAIISGEATYWVIRVYDPSDGATLVDADSTPTVAVRRNGASTGDSVTVTKRSSTTGIYDCSVTVGSTAEGDSITFEESAVISSTTYQSSWEATVLAPMRGTDSASTHSADDVLNGLRQANLEPLFIDWARQAVHAEVPNVSSISGLFSRTGTWSLSFWCRPLADPTDGAFVFEYQTFTSNRVTVRVSTGSDQGRIIAGHFNGTAYTGRRGTIAQNKYGQWHHFGAVCSAGEWALYTNGRAGTESDTIGAIANMGDNSGHIGYQETPDQHSLHATRDIRAYNRILSAAEWRDLFNGGYNQPKENPAGPNDYVIRWEQFNKNATHLEDVGPNGFNAAWSGSNDQMERRDVPVPVRYKRMLAIGNSLTVDMHPYTLAERVDVHIESGEGLDAISADPTGASADVGSYPWGTAADEQNYDSISIQVFKEAQTIANELTYIQTILDDFPDLKLCIIHDGHPAQALLDAETDRDAALGSNVQHSAACMDYIVAQVREQNPGLIVTRTRVQEALYKVKDDIDGGVVDTGEITGTGGGGFTNDTLYRDSQHLNYTIGRYLSHNCARRAMGLRPWKGIVGSGFPWRNHPNYVDMDADTQLYLDSVIDQVFEGLDTPVPTVNEIETENAIHNLTLDAFKAAGAGTGARTVTVTVDDGTDPLESARVRLTKGAETYIGSTDVSGQIEFSIDDGTWAVAITLYGHTFTPTTLVVDGDETPTYSMTAATITPPTSPDAITAVYHLTDSDLADDDGVAVYYRMITPPTGSGIGFQQAWESVTSDANGDVSIPVIPGAEYELAIGGTGSDYCKFRTTIDGAATNGYLIAPNSTYQVSE